VDRGVQTLGPRRLERLSLRWHPEGAIRS
jgi:hypothetical protein